MVKKGIKLEVCNIKPMFSRRILDFSFISSSLKGSPFNITFPVVGFCNPPKIVKNVDLPEKLTNVIYCKNPRCISSTEQELPHVFKLTDKENRVYRCYYCESKAK